MKLLAFLSQTLAPWLLYSLTMLRSMFCLITLLSAQVLAATGVEALRSEASGLRQQLSTLKATQLAKRGELSAVSGRIETLKASQKGSLLPGSELDTELKHSQELSTSLTDLAQQVSAKDTQLTAAHLALLDGLTKEMNRLRSAFDATTDRTRRAEPIAALRSTRAEREAVRLTLPAASVPALTTLKPSDNPEELLEQADLVRDQQEKVQRELKAIDARLKERRAELELDQRMQRFMGEESMFDDQDRRLRVREVTVTAAPAQAQAPTGAAMPPPLANNGLEADALSTFTAGAPNAPPTAPSRGLPEANSVPKSSSDAVDPSAGLRVVNGSDARVQVGATSRVSSGDDDVDDLEIQRVRLQKLASELEGQAKTLETRAADLK